MKVLPPRVQNGWESLTVIVMKLCRGKEHGGGGDDGGA